jgi:hypothetical protein
LHRGGAVYAFQSPDRPAFALQCKFTERGMKENVLVFNPDGSIEHTLKDSFLDTRGLGPRKIERLSSVEFDEARQKFFIKWLKGPLAGEIECVNYFGLQTCVPWTFDTYEEAVEHEIKRVNALRLAGWSFV